MPKPLTVNCCRPQPGACAVSVTVPSKKVPATCDWLLLFSPNVPPVTAQLEPSVEQPVSGAVVSEACQNPRSPVDPVASPASHVVVPCGVTVAIPDTW